ncbi:DUF2631 domain-containing protein [Actinokineospora auranticolor]|uniref:Uncharacterized protein DUF2631 n=1 Tax=Actinokineospora auranticolor TaxID=155976 RepID=A0A2S6GFH3_9PSEU|nr:DUF2631 domain-containing protein [Actinokineospora auranticolor]PPK63967.1 uncharacterized protein DUF2631 [Actinokineospora auranticolor]
MANTELEKRKTTAAGTVSPAEEPSAEWGWHGSFPKATLIAGVLVGIAMFFMLIGNHTGHTEDLWLIGVGVVLLGGVGWKVHRNRTSWRR